MERIYQTDSGLVVHLAEPEAPPPCRFVGRERELQLCKAAFGLSADNRFDAQMVPLHFRLEGPPGVGKNEIVYELARQMAKSMNLPFYSIQGHEEMTPEDLSILVVPDPDASGYLQFRLQASPLATALYEGGLFFFDEINRVPERALSPLASVLDRRGSLYSATTGVMINPRDEVSRSRFRFCCALNPSIGAAGRGVLPDYIDERTLPVIKVGYHDLETLRKILGSNVSSSASSLDSFEEWYKAHSVFEISVRQAIALVIYATRTLAQGEALISAYERAAQHILRPEQAGKRSVNQPEPAVPLAPGGSDATVNKKRRKRQKPAE